jgi:PhnB protein
MSIKSLSPYLHFNGNAEQAIALYQATLDAKVEQLLRFGEVPAMKTAPEQQQLVMHAQLRIGEAVLLLSDSMPGQPVQFGNNVQVCLNFEAVAEMEEKFEALAEDGDVGFPLHDTFWGARFGMLTDAFGVRWMFNCENPKGSL